MRVEWTSRGERRRNEVCDYIRTISNDEATAWKWEDRFFDEAARLAANCDLGRIVPEIHRQEIRELIVDKSYRIQRHRGADRLTRFRGEESAKPIRIRLRL